MKERPILFSGAMVKAILDGRKTQTRRVLRSKWFELSEDSGHLRYNEFDPDSDGDNGRSLAGSGPFDPKNFESQRHACSFNPYGQLGDRLWVRETHYRYGRWVKNGFTETGRQRWRFKAFHVGRITGDSVYYPDDPPEVAKKKTAAGWHKRPSIFMPRWASRINLEITTIRVERLQEIRVSDVVAEGVVTPEQVEADAPVGTLWREGWDSINGKRKGCAWSDNPWVWVVEFKTLQET